MVCNAQGTQGRQSPLAAKPCEWEDEQLSGSGASGTARKVTLSPRGRHPCRRPFSSRGTCNRAKPDLSPHRRQGDLALHPARYVRQRDCGAVGARCADNGHCLCFVYIYLQHLLPSAGQVPRPTGSPRDVLLEGLCRMHRATLVLPCLGRVTCSIW
jgi:hypothetical protein